MAEAVLKRRPASWPQITRYRRDTYNAPSEALLEHIKDDDSRIGREETQLGLNRELWTRDLCVVGLILGWGASLASMATGIYLIAIPAPTIPPWLVKRTAYVGTTGLSWTSPKDTYINDHQVYGVSEPAMVIIPLLLQIAIAFVSTCLDSIHSTTLRWALWNEGRLHHNTNLRLFTCSKISGPNAWPANIVSSLGLVLMYGGSTLVTFPVTVTAVIDYSLRGNNPEANPLDFDPDHIGPDKFGISFNGWGLVGLGVGLFLQSTICTWCLIHDSKQHIVGTWSSTPLATAKACWCLQTRGSVKTTLIPSTSDQAVLAKPAPEQPPMRSLVPAARTITNWVWVIFILHSIFTLVISLIAAKVQNSASIDFVRDYTFPDPIDFRSVWKFFGQVSFGYGVNPTSRMRREWIGLLLQSVAVTILLFGLHLAEVLSGLARDEAMWQRATKKHGTSPDSNMIWENARNWPCAVIFVYKALIPWIFSYAFSCFTYVYMAILPSLTITLLYLMLGVFAEYLMRAKPKGPQPATYGDVRALIALVDEWDHDPMFWGDKGEHGHVQGARVAGTGGSPLGDLQVGVSYTGLSYPHSNRESVTPRDSL